MRTVLRFGSLIHNLGPGNAVVGQAPATATSAHPPWFVWSNCHGHWHYVGGCPSSGLQRKDHQLTLLSPLGYADYRILDPVTNATVARGHKNGFCLMDSICPNGINGTFDCNTQGITAGCADYYVSCGEGIAPCKILLLNLFRNSQDDGLTCQWIDITDANLDQRKTYTLSVKINPNKTFPETNYDNNQAMVPFVISKLTVGFRGGPRFAVICSISPQSHHSPPFLLSPPSLSLVQHVSTGKLERPAEAPLPFSPDTPPVFPAPPVRVASSATDPDFADLSNWRLLRTHAREGDATGQGSIPVAAGKRKGKREVPRCRKVKAE